MEMSEDYYTVFWANNEEDKLKLWNRLQDLGACYFDDMLFECGSATEKVIMCQFNDEEKGWVEEQVNLPDELKNFSYNFFNLKVEELSDCGGYFDNKEQSMCISTDNLDNDSVILHEMIHLHEYVINGLPMFYHDVLIWVLYSDLKNKINDLDSAISYHAHILNQQKFYYDGGLHDILFLLKSFDLDIRLGHKLGTILGYNAQELFKDFSYK